MLAATWPRFSGTFTAVWKSELSLFLSRSKFMGQPPRAKSHDTCTNRLFCTYEPKNMATGLASAWFSQRFIGDESESQGSRHRCRTLKIPQLIRRNQMKTSKSEVFLRSCFVIFCVFLPLSWIWNAATGTNFWKPWEMAISAVLTVAFFGGFAWLVTKVGLALIRRRQDV